MIALAIIVIALGYAAYWSFDRWCTHKEEMFRMAAQLEEIRCCYDSEQSFMDLEDDPEHIESISPEVEDDVDYARHGRGE